MIYFMNNSHNIQIICTTVDVLTYLKNELYSFYFDFLLCTIIVTYFLQSILSATAGVNCEYWSVLLLSIDFPGSGREENTGGFQSEPAAGLGVICDVPPHKLF